MASKTTSKKGVVKGVVKGAVKAAASKPPVVPPPVPPLEETVECVDLEDSKKELIRQELEAIQEKHDEKLLVPELVEKWAKAHKQSAIGKELTWDDAQAARKYRIGQIRNLIRVVIHVPQSEPQRIRAFISVPSDRLRPGGGYRSMPDAVSRARVQLMEEALNQLQKFGQRFTHLPELDALWPQVIGLAKDYIQKIAHPEVNATAAPAVASA